MSPMSRLETLKDMAARVPDDPQVRLFLAHELVKIEAWGAAAEEYAAHVRLSSGDTGAAWKSLGLCRERLGQVDAAAEAYTRGLAAARAHGHDGLASEISFLLDELRR